MNRPTNRRLPPKKADRQSDESIALARAQTGFNRILAFCGIATLFVIGFQVWINRGQLATQRAELRAYVSFKINLNAEAEPKPDTEYLMPFECRNHGKTPAIALGFRGSIWILSPTDAPPLIADGFDEERLNLFPDERMEEKGLSFTPNTQKSFKPEEIREVIAGRKMYVIGLRVRYRDVFDTWHETEEFWGIRYAFNAPHFQRMVAIIPGTSRIT